MLPAAIAAALITGSLLSAPASAAVMAEAFDTAARPLCLPGLSEATVDKLIPGLYGLGDGQFTLLPSDDAAALDCSKATTAGHSIELDGEQLPLLPLEGEGSAAAEFNPALPPALDVQVNLPVICDSRFSGNGGMRLNLRDSNGDLTVLGGIARFDYRLGTHSVLPVSALVSASVQRPWLNCAVFNPSDYATDGATGNSGPRIFTNGFEPTAAPPAGASLTIQLVDETGEPLPTMRSSAGKIFHLIEQRAGVDFDLRVRVRNGGSRAAQQVRIHEFRPRPGGLIAAPQVSAGADPCRRGETACVANPTAPTALDADIASVAANGGQVILELGRNISLGSGEFALTGFAAFSNPSLSAEADPSDNAIGVVIRALANALPRVLTPIADQASDENAVIALDIAPAFADDDESDVLSFSLASGSLPTGLSLASNGLISGTISFDAVPNTQPTAEFTATIAASDGFGGSVNDTFVWTVTDVNRAPVAGTPVANQSSDEGAVVSLNVAAAITDPDGDVLTYSLAAGALPPGLSLSEAGLISGTISFEAAAGSPYSATLQASDGRGGSVQAAAFGWTVNNVNRSPAIADDLTAPQSFAEGTVVDIATAAGFSDPDGDALSFSATGLPDGLAIDEVTGAITGTLPAVSANTDFNVEITASDAALASVSQAFTLTITPINTPPSFTLSHSHVVVYKNGATPRRQDESIDLTFVASRGDNCFSNVGTGPCTVTVLGLIGDVLANDEGEQVRAIAGSAMSCSSDTVLPGDGFTGFPPQAPAETFVGSGSDLDLQFTYIMGAPTGTQFSCLIEVEDNGNPASETSEDVPAHRLTIEFKDAPPT